MTTKENIAEAFRSSLNAVNRRDNEGISKFLSDKIIHNGETIYKDDYIRHITKGVPESSVDHRIDLDMLAVNNDASSLAARLIHQVTLTDQQHVEWPENSFVWFDTQGRILRIQSLVDDDVLRSGTAPVPVPRNVPDAKQAPLPPGSDLAAMYRDYIHAINTLTMREKFPSYCHPTVTHNARALGLDEYCGFIEDDMETIRGLTFTVKAIVADDEAQHVAARIEFTGTPAREFRGIQPNGKPVRFWEHVLYGLDGGKISWVWSVLDFEAYRRCLEG